MFYVSVRTTGRALSRLQRCPSSSLKCATGCFSGCLYSYKPEPNNNLIQRAAVWLAGGHQAAEIQQQHSEQHLNPHLISTEEISLRQFMDLTERIFVWQVLHSTFSDWPLRSHSLSPLLKALTLPCGGGEKLLQTLDLTLTLSQTLTLTLGSDPNPNSNPNPWVWNCHILLVPSLRLRNCEDSRGSWWLKWTCRQQKC